MRILLLTPELPPEDAGGIGTYTSTIAPALAARGHDVHVLSCSMHATRSDERDRGVWWHRRPLLARGWLDRHRKVLQSGMRLSAMLTALREANGLGVDFDVVEAPEWMASSLLVGTLRRKPVVTHLHTPLHVISQQNEASMTRDRRFADVLERTASRTARVVTSTSRLLASDLVGAGWLRAEPEIVRYPVRLDRAADASSPSSSPPIVLVVGRLERRKAPEVAIDAVGMLRDEIPGVGIWFVGRSNGSRDGVTYGEWAERRARERGVETTFFAQVPEDEARAMYGRARVVAVPSRYESFSIAALEGMTYGRPVVCTSKVGAGELIVGTDAGAVVPDGDVLAFAHALKPYLADGAVADKAGAAARSVVETQCAPDHIAELREQCYVRAIGRSSR